MLITLKSTESCVSILHRGKQNLYTNSKDELIKFMQRNEILDFR